ncbi:MAG: Cof-type HAD-IIB family hydrolase [Defluviitaleaceae bacterium]|nr:Cof-type HAD-IIB family hydrolase [Defluviitaleaceae bacterium]
MSYRLLCTDVDGTLLNSQGKITETVCDAVKTALAAGKKIVLSSGRTWHSLKFYEETLGLHIPGQYGIGFNGGSVYEILGDGEVKLLHNELMPIKTAHEIFTTLPSVITQYNEMHMLAYNNEGYLIAEEALRDSRLFDEMKRLGARVVSAYADEREDVYKILIHGKHEDLLEVAAYTSVHFAGKCQVMFSAHSLLELIPLGVDKGRGIEILAQSLGIPMDEVIAVGDEANDVAMLKAAGLGIAVANAVPSAIQAADVLLSASNNENAVSVAIHQYLLQP